MKTVKKHAPIVAVGVAAVLVLGGCSKLFEVWDPPKDRAVVGDRSEQGGDSPVYEIIEVDGGPVERERYQFGVDMVPGVIIRPGKHVLKLREQHYSGRTRSEPITLNITATVVGGKRYAVIPQNGSPAIVAERPKPHP